jgi:radical SAM protein with 4Fe4S-binding SPASM domain
MKEISTGHFFCDLHNKIEHAPIEGLLELTYRCNLNCVHCYCKGYRKQDKELDTREWKTIIDVIKQEGCFELILSGGEPLIRQDFLELYSYAKSKGFIVSIFSNGQSLKGKILDYLVKSPPFSIEITLNGITKPTYESVTRIPGSFAIAMENIRRAKEKGLAIILKTNCLKQNRKEILKIKAFTDKLLGKTNGKFHFKYDPLIYPRLDGRREPLNSRLSVAQLRYLKRSNRDIWRDYQKSLECGFSPLDRDKNYLYQCQGFFSKFYINPFGRLKFCQLSDKFSVDLKTSTFHNGFYKVFPRLLNEKFKNNSKCVECGLRPICFVCPARANLETGDEEKPVPFFCKLAKETARDMKIRP